MTTILGKISGTYHSLIRQYITKLIVVDDIVFVKGLNKAERNQSNSSVLKGVLFLKVVRAVASIKLIEINLIGQKSDAIFTNEPESRRLVTLKGKIILNDCYRYTPPSGDLLKGDYAFPFQFSIDPNTPETILSCLGSRKYHLEVIIHNENDGNFIKPSIHKPITLMRRPGDNSLLPTECVNATGNWRGMMTYNICVYSRVCKLGGSITISMQAAPNPFLNKVAAIKYVKIHLVQKTKCPKMPAPRNHSFYQTVQRELIHYQTFRKSSPLESFEDIWLAKIPETLKLKLHPYNSNLEPDESALVGMTITHHLTITLGIETTDFGSEEEQQFLSSKSGKVKADSDISEIFFKMQVYLLDPMVEIYSAPPAYERSFTSSDSGSSTLADSIIYEGAAAGRSTRSSSWLCTNGKYELEKPPSYQLQKLRTSYRS